MIKLFFFLSIIFNIRITILQIKFKFSERDAKFSNTKYLNKQYQKKLIYFLTNQKKCTSPIDLYLYKRNVQF